MKAAARALWDDFSEEKLKEMDCRFRAERISPGGSADMLALTILADALITQTH